MVYHRKGLHGWVFTSCDDRRGLVNGRPTGRWNRSFMMGTYPCHEYHPFLILAFLILGDDGRWYEV